MCLLNVFSTIVFTKSVCKKLENQIINKRHPTKSTEASSCLSFTFFVSLTRHVWMSWRFDASCFLIRHRFSKFQRFPRRAWLDYHWQKKRPHLPSIRRYRTRRVHENVGTWNQDVKQSWESVSWSAAVWTPNIRRWWNTLKHFVLHRWVTGDHQALAHSLRHW